MTIEQLNDLDIEDLRKLGAETISPELYYDFMDGIEGAEKQDLIRLIQCDGNYVLESVLMLAETYRGQDIPYGELEEILNLYNIELETK